MRERLFEFLLDRLRRGYLEPSALYRSSKVLPLLPKFERHAGELNPRPRLVTRPVSFGMATAFTAVHHRHHAAPPGHVFSLGVFEGARLCGVAIVGRPVSRHLDNGATLEITRVCADGTRNACSALLGAVRRESRKRGYARVVTYTLACEDGASLRGAGFCLDGESAGGRWSRTGRTRRDAHPLGVKQRWRA